MNDWRLSVIFYLLSLIYYLLSILIKEQIYEEKDAVCENHAD
jgi:hypothetical protein